MTDEQVTAPRVILKLSDDAILMVRELIQVSILTGTNIVDHFRGMQLEVSPSGLTPTPEYIEAYNNMVKKMNEEMVARQETAQQSVAGE